jgi:hypothetical protein
MKKKSLISIVIVSVFLITSITLAGVEPSPFQPQLNRLDYIQQRLNSIDGNIRAVLGIPPNDIRPINVVRINLMSYRLGFLNWFMVSTMDSIIDAVLSLPPDDQMPVMDALNAIENVMSNDSPEGGITEVVQSYMNEYFPSGEPIQPGLRIFYNTLIQFSGNADMITGNTTDYIGQINDGSSYCGSYDNQVDCITADGCSWVYDQDIGSSTCVDIGS